MNNTKNICYDKSFNVLIKLAMREIAECRFFACRM